MGESLSNILNRLRQPLPESAVKSHQDDSLKKFIEVQSYEQWAEKYAGELYKTEIRNLTVNEASVVAVARVYIG